jgi:hypothetical protein
MMESDRIDHERLVERLEKRVAAERERGAYEDDLSDVELETPSTRTPGLASGFDLGALGPRVRFRPELGYSSKPLIGRPITLVKQLYLRLLFYVLDDLARQTDTALARVESALAVEIATRERLELEVRELRARLDAVDGGPPA